MDSSGAEAISLDDHDVYRENGADDRASGAQWLARQGLTLIRLRPRTKKPLTLHGAWVTSCDADEIAGWFAADPAANVGIVCSSATRTVIVDADTYKGPSGSIVGLDLPDTLVSKGRGRQFIYRTDGRPVIAAAPGRSSVQVLGNNHYGACPPSVHPGDKAADLAPFPYAWARVAPIANAPEWLYALPSSPADGEDQSERVSRRAGAGDAQAARALLETLQGRQTYPSRHQRDFAYAVLCIRQGVSKAAWSEVVRALPQSKAMEGGAKQGEAYLERTWANAKAAPSRSDVAASGATAEAEAWRDAALQLGGLDERHHRVLLALGDLAVKARIITPRVSNRLLRELAHVYSGAVVAEALDWAVERKLIEVLDCGGPGVAQQVRLLASHPRLTSSGVVSTPPGEPPRLPPGAPSSQPVAGSESPPPCSTHGPIGSSMGASSLDPNQVPVSHPAFHRDAIGWSAFLVLRGLGADALRPVDLKRSLPSIAESTMHRALGRLETYELVSKVSDGRWAVCRLDLDVLDEIAATFGTEKAAHRLAIANAVERDQYADPGLRPLPPLGGPLHPGVVSLPAPGESLARALHRPRNRNTKTARKALRDAARVETNRRRRAGRRQAAGEASLVNYPTVLDPEWGDMLRSPHRYPVSALPTDAQFILEHLDDLRERDA